MKNRTVLAAVAGSFCLIVLVAWTGAGCSRSTPPNSNPTAKRETTGALTPGAASALAAKLANDECERLHKKRPFTAEQYTAVLEGDMYHWGRLDPGAPSGLSAVVSFRVDGTQPNVQLYFSTDTRNPRRR